MSVATEAGAPLGEPTHAQRMDGVYALQRHVYDATRKYYLLGRDRLIRELRPRPGDHVLEVGCGTGRNLRLIARRYPGARCYGIDISSEMLKSARSKLARDKLGGQVRLARADACRFAPGKLFGQARFERVVFSYTLSMIPDWRQALRQAAQVTAPGGEIHVVDFGLQERLPAWFARLLAAWLARFHVERRGELVEFCEQLAAERGLQLRSESLCGDYTRRLVLRRS